MSGHGEVTTEDAFGRVELAGVYVEDGALRSAARCLREAADMLEAIAERERVALLAPRP